jgi:hypothetical protein
MKAAGTKTANQAAAKIAAANKDAEMKAVGITDAKEADANIAAEEADAKKAAEEAEAKKAAEDKVLNDAAPQDTAPLSTAPQHSATLNIVLQACQAAPPHITGDAWGELSQENRHSLLPGLVAREQQNQPNSNSL